MHKLVLEDMWDYCPKSWKNFTNYIEHSENITDGNGIGDYASKYLEPYNATFVNGHDGYLEFDSAEDAVAFELRFG
jgi:hypothetical protein